VGNFDLLKLFLLANVDSLFDPAYRQINTVQMSMGVDGK